jgi:hypothetical protein
MRFSLVCISSIGLRSTMDQSGSQRTSFQFSIDADRPKRVSSFSLGLTPRDTRHRQWQKKSCASCGSMREVVGFFQWHAIFARDLFGS